MSLKTSFCFPLVEMILFLTTNSSVRERFRSSLQVRCLNLRSSPFSKKVTFTIHPILGSCPIDTEEMISFNTWASPCTIILRRYVSGSIWLPINCFLTHTYWRLGCISFINMKDTMNPQWRTWATFSGSPGVRLVIIFYRWETSTIIKVLVKGAPPTWRSGRSPSSTYITPRGQGHNLTYLQVSKFPFRARPLNLVVSLLLH